MTQFNVSTAIAEYKELLVAEMPPGTVFIPTAGFATDAQLLMTVWGENGVKVVALDGSGHTWEAQPQSTIRRGIPCSRISIFYAREAK